MQSKKIFSILPLGGAGAGKSTFCNYLLDGEDSGTFKASQSTEGGETKEVSFKKGKALGNKYGKKLLVYDVPGLCDMDLPITTWVEEIHEKIPSTNKIDMVLIVVPSNVYRMTSEQILALMLMKDFLENLKFENIFLVLTHCDLKMPTEDFIQRKLASFKRYCEVDIPEDNVVLFEKTKESLESFITKLVGGDASVPEDALEKLEEIEEGLPELANQVDEGEGRGSNIASAFEAVWHYWINPPNPENYEQPWDDERDEPRPDPSPTPTPKQIRTRSPKPPKANPFKDMRLKENRVDGLNKDGTPDMRYKANKDKNTQEEETKGSPTEKQPSNGKSSEKDKTSKRVDGYTKDGGFDMRTTEGKRMAAAVSTSESTENPSSQSQGSSQSTTGGYTGPTTSSGQPDMRTTEARQYFQSQRSGGGIPFVSSTPSSSLSSGGGTMGGSDYTGRLTASGKPDMRTTQAQQYVQSQSSGGGSSNVSSTPSGSSSSGGGTMGGSSYTGRITASGNPDMRTTQAQQYVQSQSSGGGSSNVSSTPSGSGNSNVSSTPSGSSSSGGGTMGGSSYTGRTTLNGDPDLRTKEGKAWSASKK